MNIWQTQTWWKLLKKTGQVENVFHIDDICVEKRKVSFWEFGLFVLWLEREPKKTELSRLIELCKKENCLFIQIETFSYLWDIAAIPSFQEKYYKKFIPPYTAVLDLTTTEEELLKQMKPKWRYNIGLAQKKGVTCAIVEKNAENISEFFHLMKETTSRDNFSGNTQKYYETFLKELTNSELILAYYLGKVIAWGIFVFDETALYYYGASSSKERNVMAPYLVQWTAIQEAKKRGSRLYDFLWVAGKDEIHSPLLGVTDFKLKFTSDTRLVSRGFIYIYKKKKYFFIKLLKKLSTIAKIKK